MTELLQHIQEALSERYVVEREIGRGGMAFVFLARDRRYERPVAIKVLNPHIATAVGSERFLREIRITAQLQHTHIVPLLDSGQSGDLLYSVMPYIEGESLRDRLMAQGRLGVYEALFITCEIADALDYAHRHGVIHRDIKPENIMISNGHAVVADFGIARALDLAGGQTLTGAGFPIGTAAYMSPEQATAESAVDGRSDIYSLGCVLYEMLAGRMAFSGPNLKSVLTQQLTTDPPIGHISRPDIPGSAVAIVRRCMAKQPAERYATAGELTDALQATLAELPRVSNPGPQQSWAHAPSAVSGPRRSAGRWLIPAALVVTALLALTIAYPGRDASRPAALPAGPYTASVAVLPFDDFNGDAADDYFSEGITEEIINQLAQVESLKVISRTSVMAIRGTQLTLPQIAETLGVQHIVEGSVRRQGNRVRVTAELIEADTDAHLWAGSFEGDLADSFTVQQEIARKVSGQLLTSIEGLRPMAPNAMPAQGAAFDALLRGRHLLERRTAESMEDALGAFQESVRADSNYAPALAGLSNAYTIWVVYGYRGGPERYSAMARAAALAERAVALDPELAEAHHALSDALSMAQAPDEEVIAELRTARHLMPGSAELYMAAAHALARSGRREAALRQAQRALALDPLSTGLRHSAIVLALGARQYDLAFEEAHRASGFAPGDPIPAVLQGYALLMRGEPARCVGLDVGPWLALKAMCLHEVGRTAESKALSDSLETELLAGRYFSAHQYADMAAYHARLGDAGRSLEWLERTARLSPTINYWQLHSGLFDRVRDDPRFGTGLRRLEEYVRARVAEERGKLGSRLE
ncbi:MAG: protein kinase [Gemmatimonadales bacterium]|nr:protein kinase [Gemmatimonadales bacterium]